MSELSELLQACAISKLAQEHASAAPSPQPPPAGTPLEASSAASAAAAAERFVRRLLRQRQVLRAVRVARSLHVRTVLPKEFLAVAAESGSTALMASVYRAFREALMPSYPKLDVAIRVLRDKREGTHA